MILLSQRLTRAILATHGVQQSVEFRQVVAVEQRREGRNSATVCGIRQVVAAGSPSLSWSVSSSGATACGIQQVVCSSKRPAPVDPGAGAIACGIQQVVAVAGGIVAGLQLPVQQPVGFGRSLQNACTKRATACGIWQVAAKEGDRLEQ